MDFGEIGKTALEQASDFDLVRKLFTEDHVATEVCATGFQYNGIEDVLGREFTRWMTGFPDLNIVVKRVVAADGVEAVEAICTGTHEGEFELGQVLQPTGRKIDFPFVSLYEIENGRAKTSRHYWDDALIMNQLGVLDLGK